jgi:hypothetical protein
MCITFASIQKYISDVTKGMWKRLKMSVLSQWFFKQCSFFYSLTPNYWTKVPPDLFYGEICWTKLSFPHSESEFAWEVPLELNIYKFWVRSFISWPQITQQKCHQIDSTVKFVEQNFHSPSLSRNLNSKILSTPLSFKYKIVE